jgi:hypothetical protein
MFEWVLAAMVVTFIIGAILLVLRGRRSGPQDEAYRELRDREAARQAPQRDAEERALQRAREDAERRQSVD